MSASSLHEGYFRLISGEQRGPRAALLRGLLSLASVPYRAFMAARQGYYHFAAVRVEIPVISVGNLTVGGTGKTPLVAFIARRLVALGRRPIIVSRGYGRRGAGPGDEAAALRAELPQAALHVESPDRPAAISSALQDAIRSGEPAPDVAILDDGFQHLRLRRDLDIVTIDATRPFGFGHLLPRGLLREPPSALRRADGVVITRSDQVAADELAWIEGHVSARLSPGAAILHAVHQPVRLRLPDGREEPVEALRGSKVYAFCGLGNPEAFYRTLEAVGAEIVGRRSSPDHHAYGERDGAKIIAEAQQAGAARIITTSKDAVKLKVRVGEPAYAKSPAGKPASPDASGLAEPPTLRLAALEIELRLREGPAALDELLRQATGIGG